MTKRIKIFAIIFAMIAGIAAVNVNHDKLFEISKNLEIFVSTYKELNANFADELDPGTLMRTAIDAMTHSLDPYTVYYSESQTESYRIFDDERYQGIGAKLALIENKLTVVEPFEKGPAQVAGIKAGDVITSVDGIDIRGKNMDEINIILRGLPGTDVQLNVQPYNSPKIELKKLTRGDVNIPNVPYSGFVSDGIGYISLTIFTQNAAENIQKAFKEFKDENPNLQGVIIDLRHNGGGLLHEAVKICNTFLPMGETVVTTKSKIKEKDQVFKTMAPPMDLDVPVAILIDNMSASASEIVSGVLQDMDRAVLIGQLSYGKGLVQNFKDLPYNSRLKLTTAKYYIPSGRCIQATEYENGIPVNIPDERRSKFKTKNGRIVLDGGGVSPDIQTPVKKLYPITQALLDQYFIFEYANKYCEGKEDIGEMEDFKFDGYEDFVKYVKGKDFKYETEIEKLLKKTQEEFEKSGNKTLSAQVSEIEDEVIKSKSDDWANAKVQIINEIEQEIISRYYFQKGKVYQTLSHDPDIKEAVSVLKDTKRYKKILSGK